MKIAVPCDEKEEVFGHFGKASTFKIYELTAGGNISTMMVTAGGNGHKDKADFLINLDLWKVEQGILHCYLLPFT